MELKEQLVRREYIFSADEISTLLKLDGKVVFASYDPVPHAMNPNTFIIKTEEGVSRRTTIEEHGARIEEHGVVTHEVTREACETRTELVTQVVERVEPTKIEEVAHYDEPKIMFVREVQPPVLARDYEEKEGLEVIEIIEEGLIDE